MVQETVRQHYVPRTYLKHFSEVEMSNFFFYALPTDKRSASTIFRTNIVNVCLQKHIYTLPGATVQERMLIEKIYSDVFEKEYDQVYQLLTDPQKINLTKIEREQIISTVVTMFYRTPNWNKFYYDFMNQLLERAYYGTKHSGHDYFMFENSKISIAGKSLQDLQKEHIEESKPMLILSGLRHAMKLIALRSVADCIIVTKLNDKDGFITSDNPVTCNNVNGGHIMPIDPSNIFSLPLDSQHLLTLLPLEDPESKHYIRREGHSGKIGLMAKLASNYGQEKNAQNFLLGNKNNLEEYLQDIKRTEDPSPDKEMEGLKSFVDNLNKIL